MESLGNILIGVGIGVAVGAFTMSVDIKTNNGYYECIETLPRNQDCKLIAVPVEEK